MMLFFNLTITERSFNIESNSLLKIIWGTSMNSLIQEKWKFLLSTKTLYIKRTFYYKGGYFMKKTILITGATNGIGKETARALAKEGHTVIIHGRDNKRTKAVRDELIKDSGNNKVDMLIADLFSLKEVRRMSDAFKKKYDSLDVLINNAGGMMNKKREVTKEGLEKTLTLNLFSPFLLIQSLLDMLKKSSSARIINVSSEMHKHGGKPNLEDFQLEQNYKCTSAYGLSKLYLQWISHHLIMELKQNGIENITVNTVHPAASKSNFGVESDKGFINNLIFKVAGPFALTTEQGAESSIYLASSNEVEGVTGKYYGPKKKEANESTKFHSQENEQMVWDYCMKICAPYLN